MTYLIHGATGAQGSPVLASLLASGASVTAGVRDPSRYEGGGTAVALDLMSVASLAAAYEGVDGVFAHLPIGSPEQQLVQARNIVSAVEQARPARVVVSTSGYPTEGDGAAASPVGALIAGLQASGVSVAIAAPRLYLENLFLPPVAAGIEQEGVLRYPIRDDYAVSWSSHLDVADVVVRLLQDASSSGVVGVGALPGLVGADLAAGFTAASGWSVRFEAQGVDDFARVIEPLFGQAGAEPVAAAYRWRATLPSELIDPATSAQKRLGLRPRTVEQWLSDIRS
nr:NAD(P)H-binding protein [Microbacterium hydrocarbonoxydans]